jgi:hypothetical protein
MEKSAAVAYHIPPNIFLPCVYIQYMLVKRNSMLHGFRHDFNKTFLDFVKYL